jgi:signal transduction histidine kinase/ActR/RegA family two-component response regulator
MFVTGRDGRILSLNPVAQQLVGRHQDVVGTLFHDVVGCLASAEASYRGCPLEQTLRTGEVTMVSPHQWIRADGTGIEIAATFWPRGRGPEPVGAIVICRDLTVERETERSIQRVARLAEDAPNPIVEFDEDGVMLYANTAMVELLNYGTSIQGRVEAVLPPNLLEVLNDCLASQQPTVRLEHRVEDRILAWSFFPLGSSKQVRVYGTDITADVALRRAKEAAEESARAKAIFLATMSHELRTPMNGVLGCTQLLQDTSLTDQQRQLLETMHRSAESLLVLVNDILDFSKIEAGKMTLEVADVEIRPLIEDVITLTSEVAKKKGLNLRVQLAPDIPAVLRGDPIRLRQVLFNLVGNAVKFTEQGGVDVLVRLMPCNQKNSDAILLYWTVKDTGIGISADQQARLFGAYAQAEASTARRFGGTGLGLMICCQLVELMGGAMMVESKPGEGSAFSYTTSLLPAIQRETSAHVGKASTPSMTDRTTALRVLVVDDNEINQVVACKFLQKLGCQVEVARNGREAVESIARATYDAVLMDCEMPEMTGYEATQEIRRQEQHTAKHLPIIALTGHASPEDAAKCRQAGMDDVLTKPLTLPALREKLERLLAGPASLDA